MTAVSPLGDDPFPTKPTGVPEHRLSLALDVIDVEEAVAAPAKDAFQTGFALLQGLAPDLLAIELDQVEDVQTRPLASSPDLAARVEGADRDVGLPVAGRGVAPSPVPRCGSGTTPADDPQARTRHGSGSQLALALSRQIVQA